MGKIIITEDTTKHPITMIGRYAGECWGADTSDPEKNYQRGLGCLKSEHGRTWEFPDIYMSKSRLSIAQKFTVSQRCMVFGGGAVCLYFVLRHN